MMSDSEFENLLYDVKNSDDENSDNEFVVFCAKLVNSYRCAEIMRGGVVPRKIACERLHRAGFDTGRSDFLPYTYTTK